MLMRILCFYLIASGGILMAVTAVTYNKLLSDMRNTLGPISRKLQWVYNISRILPFFFVIGFFIGATDVLLRDVEPIYLFVGFVFFFGSLFIFILVQNQKRMTASLQVKNAALEHAVEQITDNNRKLQSEVESRVREVVWQDKLLHTVNDVAAILLATEAEDFVPSLHRCMGMLAKGVDADRVYIWKNHTLDGQLRCTQVYEWSETADPQQGNALTIDISYSDTAPSWEGRLSSGRSINGPVRLLSESERSHLGPQGVVSILIVPIFLQDSFWGFMGFDDCHSDRFFSAEEEGILRSGSLLIANVMLRNEIQRDLLAAREAALASTRAKSEFLSNMSHEIRTPINAITGMTTIAQGSDDTQRIQDCLSKIQAASRQLLGLINDVLDISKIEANKLQLAHEPFDLVAAIHNVHSIISVQAQEKEQTLTLDLSPELPGIALGDDMRLSQILLNLLTNAVKFTPEHGHISLTVRCVGHEDGICELEAKVRDDGIGISTEQQQRLFQAFEQADRGTSRRFGGTGLGLVISRRIAEMMHGDITVESAPGEGSCFTVVVRLETGTADMLRQSRRAEVPGHYDFSGRTALLVEDIAINREIVLALLEDTGLAIDCAENGQVALDLFGADPARYEIVFMDIHMPVMDGYEATRRLRALPFAQAQAVPIIAMTANAFAEDIAQCLQAGMNDHIAKPIDLGILLAVLERYLRPQET